MALLYILRFFKSAFKFLCLIYKTFLVRSIYITKDPFFRKNAYDRTASMHNNDNIYASTKPQNNSFKKWYYSLMLIRPVDL